MLPSGGHEENMQTKSFYHLTTFKAPSLKINSLLLSPQIMLKVTQNGGVKPNLNFTSLHVFLWGDGSFLVIYPPCLSQLPRTTERNVSRRKIEDGVDPKQINLFVYLTSIWNVYDFALQMILYAAFLRQIGAKFVKWQMWFKHKWQRKENVVNMELEIHIVFCCV